jgi:cytochrome c553
MIDKHFPTAFSVLVVVAALAAPAKADDVANPSTQREFGAKLLVCSSCHGDQGKPKNATIPNIWGQQEDYLVKQLHDFQTGARAFEVMAWMAKTLTEAEVGPAAAYFAKKGWPARASTAASTSPPAEVAVCQLCHQQNLTGGTSPVGGQPAPRLAGQSYEYLVDAMGRFADGERTNSPDMTKIMEAIAPPEREAIARYISGL